MFTGIIEAVGTVRSVASGVITVDIGPLATDAHPGDSISVNGVCLTIARLNGSICDFDLSEETLKRATISGLRSGVRVNLERAMKADGRFGGHIVQGHVDGTAKVVKLEKRGDFANITFEADGDFLDEMVAKGSVALDGISLTISAMTDRQFTIALIPTTLEETTWSNLKVGDIVNVETDILTKVVKKQLRQMLQSESGISLDKLKEHGFWS